METENDLKSEVNSETTQCNGSDDGTSSGTLELPSANGSSLQTTENTIDSDKTNSAQFSSISTMSSEAGTPNLSVTDNDGPKESLSGSYVKLSN